MTISAPCYSRPPAPPAQVDSALESPGPRLLARHQAWLDAMLVADRGPWKIDFPRSPAPSYNISRDRGRPLTKWRDLHPPAPASRGCAVCSCSRASPRRSPKPKTPPAGRRAVAVALACLNLSSGWWELWWCGSRGASTSSASAGGRRGSSPFPRQLARAQFSSRPVFPATSRRWTWRPARGGGGGRDGQPRACALRGRARRGEEPHPRAARPPPPRREGAGAGPSPASPSDVLTDRLERGLGVVDGAHRLGVEPDSSAGSDGGASDSSLRTDSTMSLGGASSVAGSDGGSGAPAQRPLRRGRGAAVAVERDAPAAAGARCSGGGVERDRGGGGRVGGRLDRGPQGVRPADARRRRARSGRSVPVVVVCTKTDVAPCPLPQMDAALTENADVVAVSACAARTPASCGA